MRHFKSFSSADALCALFSDESEEQDGSIVREVPAVIKVFKTTLDDFRNRSEYIRDDPRFANRLSKHNAGKLVKLWAEKEMYNLNRMQRAGIPCPHVLAYRKHVLVLSLIGTDGQPAPKLRDAVDALSAAAVTRLYRECMLLVRSLYQDARLVHADLSEYNILYHEGRLVFIDVSQAVDITHPRSLVFLHRDLTIMRTFFANRNASGVLSPLQMIAFVTDMREDADKLDDYDALAEEARQRVSRSGLAVDVDERLTENRSTDAEELVRVMEVLLPNYWPPRLVDEHEHVDEGTVIV